MKIVGPSSGCSTTSTGRSAPTPGDHPTYGVQILRDHGYPEDIVRAALTQGEHTCIPRESQMEHTLSSLSTNFQDSSGQ